MTDELITYKDQTYTPAEWARREKDLAWERAYNKRPEVRAKNREWHRKWVAANREHYLAYKREWARKKRAGIAPKPQPVRYGALHSISCTDRTWHPKRKRCQPIPIYDPRLVAE